MELRSQTDSSESFAGCDIWLQYLTSYLNLFNTLCVRLWEKISFIPVLHKNPINFSSLLSLDTFWRHEIRGQFVTYWAYICFICLWAKLFWKETRMWLVIWLRDKTFFFCYSNFRICIHTLSKYLNILIDYSLSYSFVTHLETVSSLLDK